MRKRDKERERRRRESARKKRLDKDDRMRERRYERLMNTSMEYSVTSTYT